MNIALIVASGRGKRIHSSIPKQFIEIAGKYLICYTIEAFEKNPFINEIVIVTLKEFIVSLEKVINLKAYKKVNKIVIGGETRQDSVRNGLNAIGETNDVVLIHDGDRPFINHDLVTRLIAKTKEMGNAVPVVNVNDFPYGTSNSGRKIVVDEQEFNVQTPQCFVCSEILKVHNRLTKLKFNDDASMIEYMGQNINYIEGNKENIKITTDDDLIYLKRKLGDE